MANPQICVLVEYRRAKYYTFMALGSCGFKRVCVACVLVDACVLSCVYSGCVACVLGVRFRAALAWFCV
jgi:hypothetical protein